MYSDIYTERKVSPKELMDEIKFGIRTFSQITVEGNIDIDVTGISSLELNEIDVQGNLTIKGRIEGKIKLLNSVVRENLVYRGLITKEGNITEGATKVLGVRKNYTSGEINIY